VAGANSLDPNAFITCALSATTAGAFATARKQYFAINKTFSEPFPKKVRSAIVEK
jgi:hypothetical protein